MNIIEINNLSYKYPEDNKKSLTDINISIKKGEILLICGNSGSGKSTLAKCIAGSIPNFYGGELWGDILINNKLFCDIKDKDRAGLITMVFQDPERQIVMNTVHREIAFGLQNIGIEENIIKKRIFEAMQFCNIQHIAYSATSELSGGEKQKVAIASALAYSPQCIVLDEPCSQLDPQASEDITYLIKKINEELGITIIIIEQRISKWFFLSDRILLLENGKIIFLGTNQEAYECDNKELFDFFPTRIKLSKVLNIKNMPHKFNENIEAIKKLNNEYKENIKISTNIYKEINVNINKETSNEVNNVNSNISKRNNNIASNKNQNINNNNKEDIILIKKLYVNYINKKALEDINFSIKKGDFLGLIGPNGSGKSTLLKSIIGLIPYKGSIKINKNEVKNMRINEISKLIGYVSQNPNDYISKDTVYDEVKFTLDNYGIKNNCGIGDSNGIKNNNLIDEILKALGIYHLKNKNPRDISGGERQRVAIASILVLKPKILLLDEPTRGLDTNSLRSLGNILKKLNEEGTTIILITHDMEFACEYCKSFSLLFNGELICSGDRNTIFSEGIYYTTEINKLIKHKNSKIFTLEEAIIEFSSNGEVKKS